VDIQPDPKLIHGNVEVILHRHRQSDLLLSVGNMRNSCRIVQYSAPGDSKFCGHLPTDVDAASVCLTGNVREMTGLALLTDMPVVVDLSHSFMPLSLYHVKCRNQGLRFPTGYLVFIVRRNLLHDGLPASTPMFVICQHSLHAIITTIAITTDLMGVITIIRYQIMKSCTTGSPLLPDVAIH